MKRLDRKGKIRSTAIAIFTIVAVSIALIPANAGTISLGWTEGSAVAEWSTDQVKTGAYSVHLKTTGDPGDGDEARVVIPLPEGTTLGDIESISWFTYVVETAGYPPHVDLILDKNGDGTRDDALVAEYAYQNEDVNDDYSQGSWIQTFEGASGKYPTWAEKIPAAASQTEEEVKSVQDKTCVWLYSLGQSESSLATLSDYKAGTVDSSVDSTTVVLCLEFEVDNWIPSLPNADAYIDDIEIIIAGETYTYSFDYVEIEKDWYRTGDVVKVTVTSPGANSNPARYEDVQVRIEASSGDYDDLTCHETEPDSGVFEVTFTLVEPPASEGELAVETGDTITASYGTDLSDEATVDDVEPEITSSAPTYPAEDEFIVDNHPEIRVAVRDNTTDTDTDGRIQTALLWIDGDPTGAYLDDSEASDTTLIYEVPDVSGLRLRDGSHILRVYLVDRAGNSAEKSWEFTVDTVKPELVSMEIEPTPASNQQNVTFTLTFSEDMDQTVTPDLAFDPAIEFDGQTAVWKADNKVEYTVNFTETHDYAKENVTCEVSGFRDLAGKQMADNNENWFLFDNVDPKTPTGLSAEARPGSVVLTWTAATDDEGGAGTGVVGYNVYWWNASEDDWVRINDEMVTETEFTHFTREVGQEYKYTVRAIDAAGNEGAMSDEVKVTTSENLGFTLSLVEGWNLVSLPLIPQTTNITEILEPILDKVDSVWYYDAQAGEWLTYDPDGPSDLFTMEDGKGYWIKMKGDAEVVVVGSEFLPPPASWPEYTVVEGWNLIGFKSMDAMTADEYLSSIEDKWAKLYTVEQGRLIRVPGGQDMEPGRGYWIYCTEAGRIAP